MRRLIQPIILLGILILMAKGNFCFAEVLDQIHLRLLASRYPQLIDFNSLSYLNEVKLNEQTAESEDLEWINLNTEPLPLFGTFGGKLAKSLVLPNPKNPLDNPESAIVVRGKVGAQLALFVSERATAMIQTETATYVADGYTLCNNNGTCAILLSQAPVEELLSSQRLGQFR